MMNVILEHYLLSNTTTPWRYEVQTHLMVHMDEQELLDVELVVK